MEEVNSMEDALIGGTTHSSEGLYRGACADGGSSLAHGQNVYGTLLLWKGVLLVWVPIHAASSIVAPLAPLLPSAPSASLAPLPSFTLPDSSRVHASTLSRAKHERLLRGVLR
jgi:hypothetical protein